MNDVLKSVQEEMMAPGQMFEVTTVEVRGQEVRAWQSAPGTLRDLWALTAGHGDKDYLVYEDERWTYLHAHQEVSRIANWLVAQGIGKGDRVAIAMRNYPEWMLSYWAITSIDAAVVGVNAWWVAEELAYALEDSDPKIMICDRERLERFDGIRDRFPGIRALAVRVPELPDWATPWSELLSADPEMPEATVEPDDDACIFYTSGTTGRPKGAQLTQRSCAQNVFSMLFLNFTQLRAIAQLRDNPSLDPLSGQGPAPASLVTTPLFHVTANNCSAQVTTLIGGKLVHMYKWDTAEALRLVEAEKLTSVTGVPVMSRELLQHPDFAKRDVSTLVGLGGGGAAVQPDLISKIDDSGRVGMQGYGMTETSGLISGSVGNFLSAKPASCGPVLPVYEVKCIDGNGNALPPGEAGEVCVRGVQVIKGYLNRPEATADTIIDGWLHTGDIGYLDQEGFLYLVDRAKDMVLRGGENVYCSEVENALFRHPAIAEAAVFSVPDDRLGEEVGTAVLTLPGQTVSADELRAFCREHLAAFKIPRYIWMMSEPLPRNASGKFLKKELQQTLDPSAAA
ncbi:MAG: AMP-binding protein [Pseudomonadota bacterium]